MHVHHLMGDGPRRARADPSAGRAVRRDRARLLRDLSAGEPAALARQSIIAANPGPAGLQRLHRRPSVAWREGHHVLAPRQCLAVHGSRSRDLPERGLHARGWRATGWRIARSSCRTNRLPPALAAEPAGDARPQAARRGAGRAGRPEGRADACFRWRKQWIPPPIELHLIGYPEERLPAEVEERIEMTGEYDDAELPASAGTDQAACRLVPGAMAGDLQLHAQRGDRGRTADRCDAHRQLRRAAEQAAVVMAGRSACAGRGMAAHVRTSAHRIVPPARCRAGAGAAGGGGFLCRTATCQPAPVITQRREAMPLLAKAQSRAAGDSLPGRSP